MKRVRTRPKMEVIPIKKKNYDYNAILPLLIQGSKIERKDRKYFIHGEIIYKKLYKTYFETKGIDKDGNYIYVKNEELVFISELFTNLLDILFLRKEYTKMDEFPGDWVVQHEMNVLISILELFIVKYDETHKREQRKIEKVKRFRSKKY